MSEGVQAQTWARYGGFVTKLSEVVADGTQATPAAKGSKSRGAIRLPALV